MLLVRKFLFYILFFVSSFSYSLSLERKISLDELFYNVDLAMQVYYCHCSSLPSRYNDLLENGDSCGNWMGPYIGETALDPWDNMVFYKKSSLPRTYRLIYAGKDRKAGTPDDVSKNFNITSEQIEKLMASPVCAKKLN